MNLTGFFVAALLTPRPIPKHEPVPKEPVEIHRCYDLTGDTVEDNQVDVPAECKGFDPHTGTFKYINSR